MIQIPYQSLSDDALLGVIDEFITRDSTVTDASLTEKRRAVLRSLEEGAAIITFDPRTQTTHIVEPADG